MFLLLLDAFTEDLLLELFAGFLVYLLRYVFELEVDELAFCCPEDWLRVELTLLVTLPVFVLSLGLYDGALDAPPSPVRFVYLPELLRFP